MITIDFETRSIVDLKKLGATRYATDPLTQVLCLSWSFSEWPLDRVELWHRDHPWIERSPRPDELLERIASGELVEAHNSYFEFVVWRYVLMHEFGDIFDVPLKQEQMRCSAAKASCVSLPRNLEDGLKAIGAPPEFLKLADGKRLINKLSKPRPRRKNTPADIPWPIWCEEEDEHKRNWEYNMQDVRAERYFSDYIPEMTETELHYWQMDWRMNERGMELDIPAVERAMAICNAEAKRLNKEMKELTADAVPKGSSRKLFRAWANRQLADLDMLGYEAGQLDNTQANTLSFALYGVPTKAGEVARAAAKPVMDEKWDKWGDMGGPLRRAMEICLEVNRTSNSKYKRMMASVCKDRRVHDIMLYNGADRTGRWSGKGIQPQNFVRGYTTDMTDIWDDIMSDADFDGDGPYDLLPLLWGDPLPAMAKACRGALIASPGCELYAADFNAIEARKLAWMANCVAQLNLFNTPGEDPYVDMARGIYSNPDLTKANKDERNLGKRAVLGLGYAMGWEKFQWTVWTEEGIALDDEFCQRIVHVYRKEKCPEVPKLWKAVETAAINAVMDPYGEYAAGGDDFGNGSIVYFMNRKLPFLHCRLPSGRLLAYYMPRVRTKINWRFDAINQAGKPCIVTVPTKIGVAINRVRWMAEKRATIAGKQLTNEAPTNFKSPHLSFMGRHQKTKKWVRLGTHGGSLVENADQASSRDLLAEAMYRVDQDERFALLLSIHDEVIAEAPIGTCSREEFENIMAEVPRWAYGMPIKAEGWIGPRMRK